MADDVDLQDVLKLFRESALHRDMTLDSVCAWLLPPLELGQYFAVKGEGKLVAVLTYAFVNDEAHMALRHDFRPLTYHEWASGPHPWIVDFVAPFGNVSQIMRTIRRIAALRGLDGSTVYFKRRYAERGGVAPREQEVRQWPTT